MLQIRVAWFLRTVPVALLFASPWQGVERTEPKTTTGEVESSWNPWNDIPWNTESLYWQLLVRLGIPIIIDNRIMTFQVSNYWFIGTLILAYYNFLYNWVPYIQQISKGLGHCSSGCLPPAVSRYLSKTVRCWRNVPSNQVFFSFLHLHWYYIQSLFESSKPLSSDQWIVITGTLHHLQGWKFCLSAFAIWEIHQYLRPWILDFQHSPYGYFRK